MVYKTTYISGVVTAGAVDVEVAQFSCPKGMKRIVREVRPYSSVNTNVVISLFLESDQVFNIAIEPHLTYNLPYVADWEIVEGARLRLIGSNTGGTDATIIVVLTYEESKA
ncbi:MAG: hypothetical protein QXV82_09345 [Ignisphaera sp.]